MALVYSNNSHFTVQKLTAASGTYTKPVNCTRIRVRMVAGGGGGGGAHTTTSNGSVGGNTTFGSSLLTAVGGSGGQTNDPFANGGGFTVNSPAIDLGSVKGGDGDGPVSSGQNKGGRGGANPLGDGGAGMGGTNVGSGIAGSGYGSGGGGASRPGAFFGGCGGGSGGYIYAQINNPSATYPFTVGTGGAGAVAGTPGAAGKDGVIFVEEFYD